MCSAKKILAPHTMFGVPDPIADKAFKDDEKPAADPYAAQRKAQADRQAALRQGTATTRNTNQLVYQARAEQGKTVLGA